MLKALKSNQDKIAIIDKGKEHSYQHLIDRINLYKSLIKDELSNGDIVALRAIYSFESIAMFIALYLNKNIVALLPDSPNLDEYLQSSNANKLIEIKSQINIKSLNPPKHDKIKELNNQSGLIIFSSGTLNKPKAIIHNLDNMVKNFADKRANSLKIILFLLFDHIGGINTLLSGLLSGSTLIIASDFSPKNICYLISKYKAHILPTTPSFLNLLLMTKEYENYDLSSLRLITYGTERMDENILIRLKNIFKKVKFIQTFGTSESGILPTTSKSSISTYFKLKPDEYKIKDGRLFLKSKTMFLGYMNLDSDNQWFDSGDLVKQDGDGFLKIIGRSKEIINVGGKKLLASEVESCILELDEIKDALVYALPCEILGQMVACDVVCDLAKSNAKELIKSHCKARLERYKVPVKINIVDEITFTNRFKKDRKLR
ncbi:fatty acid--CoA ligase family protein [Campylobacter sp. CX2-8023-23]|uniref:ANL family adenylate-forming protein n=1 Tax=Campylobacter porcelli TaxID=1660073 RepID=UPI002EAF4105|nr:fatty acid--CoA ligase family protein [Campylobacter sp. CX2-8023-23]